MKNLLKLWAVCAVFAMGISSVSNAQSSTCVATCIIQSSIGGGKSVESAQAEDKSQALEVLAKQCRSESNV